jgi:hypothetical protein
MLPRRSRWGRFLDTLFGRSVGSRRPHRRPLRSLQLERLEERRLLAATLSFNAGVLTFSDAANGNNNLTLAVAANGTYTFSDTTNTITVNPANGNPFASSMGGHVASGSGATVTSIVLNLGTGSNDLTLDAQGNSLAPLSATDGGPSTDTATVASNLVDSGALSLSGFGTIEFGTSTSGPVTVTTSGSQDYFTSVVLNANLVAACTVGNGAITFHSTVDAQAAGSAALTSRSDGTTTFDGLVGSNAALSALTVEGFTAASTGSTDLNSLPSVLANVTTAGNQDYFNALVLTGGDQAVRNNGSTSAITFHSTVDAPSSGSAGLEVVTDGTTEFDGLVGSLGPLDSLTVKGRGGLEGGTVTLDIAAPAGSPTVDAEVQVYDAPVVLAAAADLVGPDALSGVRFDGTVTSTTGNAFNLTITGEGAVFNGQVSDVGALVVSGNTDLGAGAALGAASASFGGEFTSEGVPSPAGTPLVETTGPQAYNVLLLKAGGLLVSSGGGDITVTSRVMDATSLTIETDGTVTFPNGALGGASLTIEGFTTPSAGSAAFGGGAVETSGAQDYFNPVTLTSDEVFESTGGGNITFHSTVDAQSSGGQALTTETDGAAAFDGVVGGNFPLKSLTAEGFSATGNGTTDLNATPDASVTTVGGQDYFNPVTLGDNQVLVSTGAGNITFHSTVDGQTNATQSLTTETDGTTTFDGEVGSMATLSALTVEGFTAPSDGQTDLNAPIGGKQSVTTAFNQDYFNAVVLTADQLLQSNRSTGAITFHSTVDGQTDGAQALTLVTDGVMTFDGIVGGAVPLENVIASGLTAASDGTVDLNAVAPAGSPTIRTGQFQIFVSPVVLSAAQDLLSERSVINFDSTLTSTSGNAFNLTVDSEANVFEGQVTDVGALDVTGGADFEAPVSAASVTADSATLEATASPAGSPTVLTTGAQEYGIITVFGDQLLASSGAGDITASVVGGTGSLTTETDGTTTLNGVNPEGHPPIASLTVEGFSAPSNGTTVIAGGLVETSGNQDYFNPVTLTSDEVFESTGGGNITFHSTVDAQSSGGQALTTETDGAAAFDGVVGGNFALKSLTAEGFLADANGTTDLNATPDASVTTVGSQDYFNPVTLGVDQILASTGGGAITFHSTVDGQARGGESLTTETDGTATFDGVVGGIFALQSLTVEGFSAAGNGSTDLNAGTPPTVTTTGGQDYFNPVTLTASQVLVSTGGGNITFHSTVDAQAVGVQSLTVETDGTTAFDGVVGGQAALESLTVEGFSTSAKGSTGLNAAAAAGVATVTTTSTQDYFNPVALGADQVVVSNSAGNISFHSTVDGQAAGVQSLTTESDGSTTFDGIVGGKVPLETLTVEGFTAAVNGSTDLNAAAGPGVATVTTASTQDYFNPVTLSADQVIVSTGESMFTSQELTFHSTVDAQTSGGQALTTETDGIATFDGVIGGNFALRTLTVEGFSAGADGITEFDAVAVPDGAITVRTAGKQDYFNEILISSDQVLVSTGAGNITFHLTVGDQPLALPGALTTETDGILTFDGDAGAIESLRALLVEGFSAPGNGFTDLNGGLVSTSGFATDSGGNKYSQEYDNPVTLFSPTNSLLSAAFGPGDGTIIFGSTIDSSSQPGQSLDVQTPDTIKFAAPVGGKDQLATLQLLTEKAFTQPAAAPFSAADLALTGIGNFDLSQANNRIATFAAGVNGTLSFKDTVQLTIDTIRDVQDINSVTGVSTIGNFTLTLEQGVRINQVVNLGTTGSIDAVIGLAPVTPAVNVTVAANLIATSATFDGTNSVVRDVFNIAPSIGTVITVIGKPHILAPGPGNELDLDLQAGLPGFQNAGSPTGTKLTAFPPPDPAMFPFDGSGFYTFANRAQLNYQNIGQLGQLQASAYSYLNRAGVPVIVIQVSQGSVDQNGNIIAGLSTPLLAPLNVLQPPNNPFIFSPAVNSPYPPSPPSVEFAFVRGGGVPDLLIAGGAAEEPVVTVIDSNTLLAGGNPANAIVSQFYAFDPSYLGGISLAAGDLTGNGMDEIVTGMANGGDVVRTYVDAAPDPRGPDRVFFDQAGGPLGNFHAFGGFGGGVRVAVAGSIGQDGVLFVAPGPGLPGMISAYDGASGTPLPGLVPASLFGNGYEGGVTLAATGNYNGTGSFRAVLAGMSTEGSAVDLFSFNNDTWAFLGENGEAFPAPVSGRTSTGPVDPESAMGVGSLAFGTAGVYFAGSGSTQAADLRQFPNNGYPEVGGFPVAFLQGEVQVSGVVSPTLADPPPDAPPTVTTSAPSSPVVAPGGSDTINFTAGSVMYPDELTVSAASSNQVILPDTDLLLTKNGDEYTLTLKPPAGTSGGTATVTVTVTDPQGLSTPLTFNVIVDQAPILPALSATGTLTLRNSQFPFDAYLDALSPLGSTLTYSATAYAYNPVYELQQKYQFQGVGYFVNGAAAYVLQASADNGYGNAYYLLNTDGALYAYDGSGNYATSFNGTAIANLGPDTYIDPTLLLDAQPPVDYTSLYNLEQKYNFQGLGYMTAGGGTAYVLQASSDNGYGNAYFLLRSDGALFAYDGSGDYATSFGNQQAIANFGASVYLNPTQLLDAAAPPSLYPQLYNLNQQYDLKVFNGSFYPDTLGNGAKWIYSPVLNQYGQNWYTLTLSADGTQALLRAWEGYQDSAVGAVIATLPASVYSNPSWLTNATTPPALLATVGVDGSGNLSILLPSQNYTGSFMVDVTVSDGMLSTSRSLLVTSTDTAPTITVQQNSTTIPQGGTQTVAHGSFPLTDTVTTADAAGNPVTTTASVSSYSPLFSLQQKYQFRGLGYYTAGATAYVLQAASANKYGNPYYLLRSDGSLFAYDGSGSYSHSFANGTAVSNLGANAYADPSLLFNAQPAVDYTSLYNLQEQYQFAGLGYYSAGGTAYVLRAASNNSFGNPYYLLKANGSLYAYDGSGSYAQSFAGGNPIATVDPGVYVNPSLLLDANAAPSLYPQLYQAESQFDLEELGGSFYTGSRGNAAEWLYSPVANQFGQHWYTLVLPVGGTEALLYAWDGGNSSVPNGETPVATLDASVYANPSLLTNAKAPVAATGATASVSGGVLTLNGPASFVGSVQVTVTATDGTVSGSQTFVVNSTDTPPVQSPVPAQTASRSGAPLQVTLAATSGVTYSAAAAGYSPAYNLQQVYHFTGVGFVTSGGVTAYVLHSNVLGSAGGYYLLNSAGDVYAYDGSGNFAATVANSANLIATLDPSVYASPSLLTQAQAAATPGAVVSVSGNTLTVNVAGVSAGRVFEVFVTANDGAETTRTGILVTVTP